MSDLKCKKCGDDGKCTCSHDHIILEKNEYGVPLCLRCYYALENDTCAILELKLGTIYSFERREGNISDPKFDEAGRVHDWRNHVPFYLKEMWDRLSKETRLVLAILAAEAADEEPWD